MKVTLYRNREELSEKAAVLIAGIIAQNRETMMCVASGNTPTLTYRKLAGRLAPEHYGKISVVKLDEWGGVPMDHPQTCEQYIRRFILDPFKIPADKYISFNSNTSDADEEVRRIQQAIDNSRGIDISILGLGQNGHIAFNEPAGSLEPHCHIARLSAKSLRHPMTAGMEISPSYGLTLGMGDILGSRKIIMLVAGEGKKKIAERFLAGRISTYLPASFLWLHRDTECLVDENVLS